MEGSKSDDPGPLPDGDRLLTQEEAAEVLRVNVRSVMTERYARRLGWVKVAGKIRIPMSAITAFLAAYGNEPVTHQAPAFVPPRQSRRRALPSTGEQSDAERRLERTIASILATGKADKKAK